MRQSSPQLSQWAILALLFSIHFTLPVRAEDPAPTEAQRLRERVLKLNEITGQDPMVGQIISLLEDKDNSKKLLDLAYKMAKDGEKSKEPILNVNATFILARLAQGLKDPDKSEYFYRQHAMQALKLGSSQKFVRAYTGLIDLLYASKKFAEAERVCQEFLEVDGDDNIRRLKMLVLRRMVQTQAKLGKVDEALKIVDNLIRAQPDNWLTRELKGWVLRETGKYDEAAKVYEDVLERITKDKRLDQDQKDDFSGDIRYTLSGVYIDLKQVTKAADQLKALLEKEPNNPTYNNDLGFIWADHDMNLAESEKLIRKALEEDRKLRRKANPDLKPELDKDNAAYLDSLGWVLYKQKKYKEALEQLIEASKAPEGQHLEIYDHLAEVYLALGEKEKAVEAWKKGLACDPVSRRDSDRKIEVEKKIKKLLDK